MPMLSRNRGFTLIELLVALSLLAFVSVLLYSSLRTGVTVWEHTEKRSQAFERAHLVSDFLQSTVRQAVPVKTADDKRDRVRFNGSATGVEFTGVLPLHRGVGGVYLLRLDVANSGSEEQLVFRYRLLRNAPTSRTQWHRPKVLLDGLSDVSFAYFGARHPKTPPTWQTEWRAENHLPQLVRIRYTSIAEGKVELILPVEAQMPVPYASLAGSPTGFE